MWRRKTKPTPQDAAPTRRPLARGLLGYRRAAVDERLAEAERTIADLRGALAAAEAPDHRAAIERATRRQVRSVLESAETDAARIRSEAESMLAASSEADQVIDLRTGVGDESGANERLAMAGARRRDT